MKNMIMASSSTVYGSAFLEYLQPQIALLFAGVTELLFIPYARPSGLSYKHYTAFVQTRFEFMNLKVKGIHSFSNPVEAIQNAQAIFTGGGNTFVLVDALYKNNILDVLRTKIESGTPYLGTSAGTNICGVSMQTTNDMPIVYPKSYTTLNLIPFNINAHFIEPSKDSKHKGETREIRIKEFHIYNDVPVIGLREGSWLSVKDNKITLKGELTATLFEKGEAKKEYVTNTVFKTETNEK
tara:strand:+ start:15946 stop:16662 length:717 start_codon:yes stop_codon:yes gene_type:complete